MKTAKPHYLTLDGLRGVAALSVVFYHRRWMLSSHTPFSHAWLAVDFFFLLSGFVIAFAYEERLRSGLSFPAFAWIRVQRLYPMIVAGVLLGGIYYAVALRHASAAFANVVSSMPLAVLGLPNPPAFSFLHDTEAQLFAVDPPLWSIFFEIVGNLAFALLAPRLTLKSLLAIVATAFVLECLVAFHGFAQAGIYAPSFWWGFPRMAFPFFFGVLIYRLHKDGLLPRIPLGLGFLSMVLVLCFMVSDLGAWEPLYCLACVGLLFPLIVIVGADHQPVGRAALWASFAGSMSYPIYAVHLPVFLWFEQFQSHFRISLPGKAVVPMEAAVALGAAFALRKIYDEPVRAYLSRWTRSKIHARSASGAVRTSRNSAPLDTAEEG